MILPEKADNPYQRRQFGRREISRPATATMPGGLTVECRLVNVSEGGALIDFPGGLVPARPFQLSIEGVTGTMACEPRHTRETAVGVRFVKEADGVRLIALLFPGPAPASPGELPRRADAAMVPVAVRDLRQRILSAFADRAGDPEQNSLAATPVEKASDKGSPAD